MPETRLFRSILPDSDGGDGGEPDDTTEGVASASDMLDSGECPWCDGGPYDDAHQHARMAHANAYDDLEV